MKFYEVLRGKLGDGVARFIYCMCGNDYDGSMRELEELGERERMACSPRLSNRVNLVNWR
jgi:hypothetical protein